MQPNLLTCNTLLNALVRPFIALDKIEPTAFFTDLIKISVKINTKT
jgi:hypothetical protein